MRSGGAICLGGDIGPGAPPGAGAGILGVAIWGCGVTPGWGGNTLCRNSAEQRAQSTFDFPIVNVLSDYKETRHEKNLTF